MEKEIRYGWDEILGSPGEHRLVPIEKLNVDTSYQRPLVSNSKIISYAAKWNWPLCGALLVADRDGILYVMDGQQRLAAARKRSDIKYLPCVIYPSRGQAWEAGIFWRFNTIKRQPSPHQVFKAKLLEGDKTAIALDSFVRSRGYTISTSEGVKDLDCVGTLTRYFTSSPSRAQEAFDLCVSFNDGTYRITQDIYQGAISIVSAGIKLDSTAIGHLREAGGVKINREIANQKIADNSSGSLPSARALLKIANSRRKAQNRVDIDMRRLICNPVSQ